MITKKTALKEAARFAAALDGPLGQRPMQRVVSEFLPIFRDLRSSGASWTQIAALLAAAGVRSRTGQPVSDGILRAMVSRAERESSTAGVAGERRMIERPLRISPIEARTKDTPKIQPPSFPHPAADARSPLPNVAERIRRASTLRARGGGADRG